MRGPISSKWCHVAIGLLLLARSVSSSQTREEQGREVLRGVRAAHLMIDFGMEALEFDQWDSFDLVMKLSRAKEETTLADDKLGNDEWDVRRDMLLVERLGRDMVAGKAIPSASVKILDKHFKLPNDPVTGLRLEQDAVRASVEAIERCRLDLQQLSERLAAGKPLDDDELALVQNQHSRFRSGDQLTWGVLDLYLDFPRMAKAYSSSGPRNQHAIRILLGRRGKADTQAVALLLEAIRGSTPIERYDAALAAGTMRPSTDRLIAALVNCLDDPDPRVARAAVRSLLSLNATQSAPAMLRRLRGTLGDKEGARRDRELGFAFEEYNILDSSIGFRHDLPTELIFALGRLRHQEAIPLLWDIVQGTGTDMWRYEGLYELNHGGAAIEAIVAICSDDAAEVARRALAMKSATVDALGAAANVLGECGQLTDVPVLIGLMSRLDRAARTVPDLRFQSDRSMARVTFAAERLLYLTDADEPKLAENRQALIAELRRCASGPFGEGIIVGLEFFDPDHVAVTALALAPDTTAMPNARRIAIEILGKAGNLDYVEPLLALFEDNGNATNGPVGLHAAWATLKILAAEDRTEPRVAALVNRVAERLERIELADRSRPPYFVRVLIQLDSDRGVVMCSSLALDGKQDDFRRSTALACIAHEAKPNRELAMSLQSLLDLSASDPRENEVIHAAAVRAMAQLLGLEHEESGGSCGPSVEEAVRQELAKVPRPM